MARVAVMQVHKSTSSKAGALIVRTSTSQRSALSGRETTGPENHSDYSEWQMYDLTLVLAKEMFVPDSHPLDK